MAIFLLLGVNRVIEITAVSIRGDIAHVEKLREI